MGAEGEVGGKDVYGTGVRGEGRRGSRGVVGGH